MYAIRKICALLSHFISIMQHLESVLGKEDMQKRLEKKLKGIEAKVSNLHHLTLEHKSYFWFLPFFLSFLFDVICSTDANFK